MIKNTLEETEALMAQLDEHVEGENPGHPGPSVLASAALHLSSPATQKNVRSHVKGCESCQGLHVETLAIMTAVTLDRAQLARDTGVHIHLVSMYRSGQAAWN